MRHAGLRLASALCLLCLAGAPAGAAGRSIVGEWGLVGASCTPAEGAITIAPLALAADEMSCTFSSVVRSGNVVTWKGRCAYPEATRASTVVASENGGRLTLAVDGGTSGPYRRCRG